MTFGIQNKADIMAKRIVTHADRVEFHVETPWFSLPVEVSVPGYFSVYNALAAIGVAGMIGIDKEVIKCGLMDIHVPGRAEVVQTPGKPWTVMIDYAHTPDSLENILSTGTPRSPDRCSDVAERDRTKRDLGKVSRQDYRLSATLDNPRTKTPLLIEDIVEGITDSRAVYYHSGQNQLSGMQWLPKGDVIVLAGKGHETYQIFKDRTIHYDEREIVKEILDDME